MLSVYGDLCRNDGLLKGRKEVLPAGNMQFRDHDIHNDEMERPAKRNEEQRRQTVKFENEFMVDDKNKPRDLMKKSYYSICPGWHFSLHCFRHATRCLLDYWCLVFCFLSFVFLT